MTRGDLVKLKPGFSITKKDKKWRVTKKLGEGGFGAVYEVEEEGEGEGRSQAMKIESLEAKNQVIKMEVAVLRRMRKKIHAAAFQDCGRMPTFKFNFMIMGLLGESLSDLRRGTPGRKFTTATTVRLGIQGIEAIEEIHSIGFLHRDIKPSNFAIGRRLDDQKLVYIFDFGLCRQFTTSKGTLRPPRPKAAFRGTVRYSSLSAHEGRELGRHDDLISWMYCLAEFLRPDLPWKELDKDETRQAKKNIVASQLFMNCPSEFIGMWKRLQLMDYADTPEYEKLRLSLRKIMERKGYLDSDPFDWMEGGKHFGFTRLGGDEGRLPSDEGKIEEDGGSGENNDKTE